MLYSSVEFEDTIFISHLGLHCEGPTEHLDRVIPLLGCEARVARGTQKISSEHSLHLPVAHVPSHYAETLSYFTLKHLTLKLEGVSGRLTRSASYCNYLNMKQNEQAFLYQMIQAIIGQF